MPSGFLDSGRGKDHTGRVVKTSDGQPLRIFKKREVAAPKDKSPT